MRKFLFSYFLLVCFFLSAEMADHAIYPSGDPLTSGGWKEPSPEQMKMIDSLKVFKPDKFIVKDTLPDSVDNSISVYFRPVFSQYANECAQAAGVGYTFTYELNRMRGTNANFNKNQFPHYFTYNFLNSGSEGEGSNYFDGWEILKREGCPYNQDYGGMVPTDDPDLREILWMTGYDKYERAMENRVCEVIALPCGTPEGLDDLKRWLFDHGNGSIYGGVAVFSAGVLYTWQTDTLHQNTPHSGESVITKWHTTVNHAMTIAGYNDSIRYDYNGDGRFTNDLDINGDLVVDMKDWEIGALLMVNSWGYTWGDNGRSWVMYNTLGYKHWEGGIWTQTAHAINTFDYYTPLLKLRAEIDYPDRNNLKIYAGVSSDSGSFKPDKIMDCLMLDHAGGNYPMSGDSSYIDIGLDITSLIADIENNSVAEIFLCVAERDSFFTSVGKIISMSVTDEWGNTVSCAETNLQIADNDTTYLSVVLPVYYNTPLITVSALPEIIPEEPYFFQMISRGGRDPYNWNFIIDYTENENTNDFPSGEFTAAVLPHNNPDNDIIPVELEFRFPFFGNFYDSVFVSTDGYICFENKYYYIQDELSLIENKVIAPHAAELTCYPTNGDGIYFLSAINFFTVIWDSATRTDSFANIKFACRIYSDGKIEFFHADYITEGADWYSGISNGDSKNYIISGISGIYDPSGKNITLNAPDFPNGLAINGSGVLSGTIHEYDKSWILKIRITDWNGISSEKEIGISSSTAMEEETVSDKDFFMNFPNPFNSVTEIRFSLNRSRNFSLIIFNSSGQIACKICDNSFLKKGTHTLVWRPENYSSGIYYSILTDGSGSSFCCKMLLLK